MNNRFNEYNESRLSSSIYSSKPPLSSPPVTFLPDSKNQYNSLYPLQNNPSHTQDHYNMNEYYPNDKISASSSRPEKELNELKSFSAATSCYNLVRDNTKSIRRDLPEFPILSDRYLNLNYGEKGALPADLAREFGRTEIRSGESTSINRGLSVHLPVQSIEARAANISNSAEHSNSPANHHTSPLSSISTHSNQIILPISTSTTTESQSRNSSPTPSIFSTDEDDLVPDYSTSIPTPGTRTEVQVGQENLPALSHSSTVSSARAEIIPSTREALFSVADDLSDSINDSFTQNVRNSTSTFLPTVTTSNFSKRVDYPPPQFNHITGTKDPMDITFNCIREKDVNLRRESGVV